MVLILAMVLAVSQASTPVPRKAPDNPTRASRAAKSQPKSKQTPTSPAPTAVEAITTRKDENAGKDESKEDTQKSVSVRELPPVSIARDWVDHVTWVFTLFLVIVGSVAMWVALTTLRTIKRQTKAAETAANAAKKSADTGEMALRLSERADVMLDSAGVSTGQQKITPESRVLLQFKNYGRTRANNVRFNFSVTIPDLPDSESLPLPPIPIGARDTQQIFFRMFREWVTKDTFLSILNGKTKVRFSGTLAYDDVFGQSHTVKCSGILLSHSGTFMVEENSAD